jgi:glycosyltransferase involved in cell wall biosynthesis
MTTITPAQLLNPGIDLSVVISTRDRPAFLHEVLASIAGGTFPLGRYEVIVADNGTTAETGAVVTQWRDRLPGLVHLRVPAPGLHEARHAGLAAARSGLLVFADDDIVAGARWLEAIHAAFADPAVALVGGNNLPRYAAPPPAWLEKLWRIEGREGRCIEALSVLDLGDEARDVPPEYVFGCNFSVRRTVLEQAGGFHPDGFPPQLIRLRGDGETHVSEFVRRSGWRARFVPDASVAHVVSAERMTSAYFERRYFAQGVSDSYSALRAGASRSPHLSLRGWLKTLRPPSLTAMQFKWRLAYLKGFRFHQSEVARDSALLEWVRKSSYLCQ